MKAEMVMMEDCGAGWLTIRVLISEPAGWQCRAWALLKARILRKQDMDPVRSLLITGIIVD